MSDVTPAEQILRQIIVVRDQRVLLDGSLAALYGVSTKRLNEQVKRNPGKFPADFMFRITRKEAEKLAASRSQNATLKRGKNLKYLPFAFTEHGAIQAANVLNSPAATEMGVYVVRAFVQLRRMLVDHQALAAKLAELEGRVGVHDEHLAAIIAAIRQLTASPEFASTTFGSSLTEVSTSCSPDNLRRARGNGPEMPTTLGDKRRK